MDIGIKPPISILSINYERYSMSKRKMKQSSNLHFSVSTYFPRTKHQGDSALAIQKRNDCLILGSAGTGKSYLAINKALELIEAGAYRRLLIIRSTVPTRDQGFLPGTKEEKQAVYELPYQTIVNELYSRGDAYGILKQKGTICFESTSYLRGITLDDTIILLDEVQNCTFEEINTVYTRLGENSQIIICGDFAQTDKGVGKSGIGKALQIIEQIDKFDIVYMTEDDIVRSDRVKRWIVASNRLVS